MDGFQSAPGKSSKEILIQEAWAMMREMFPTSMWRSNLKMIGVTLVFYSHLIKVFLRVVACLCVRGRECLAMHEISSTDEHVPLNRGLSTASILELQGRAGKPKTVSLPEKKMRTSMARK